MTLSFSATELRLFRLFNFNRLQFAVSKIHLKKTYGFSDVG